MNPWWWLLWAAGLAVIIFVACAMYAVVREGLAERQPCPRCGFVKGKDDVPNDPRGLS